LEIEEIRNILLNSEFVKDYKILDIKKRKNYSITFIEQENLEEDLTGLYEGLARILYRNK
jgi:hypothetical protein